MIKKFKRVNKYLNNFSNILNLFSVIIAIIALIISMQSMYLSTQKANLVLSYQGYDNGDDNIYENQNGTITLNVINTNYDEYIVTNMRPGSFVTFELKNTNDTVAKNPVINFQFCNMELDDFDEKEWQGITHNHGLGTWHEIRWQPVDNTVIHKGIPKKFIFYFNESKIYEDAYINVIISADNAKTKSFKIPVKYKIVEY